jgi:glyoxalase superfamily protein
MSRYLPPHPHLDHLKKQAKELLHELRLQNPALKLADAQHAIAREYGFASWPKLKSHVESLAQSATWLLDRARETL